MGAISRMTTPSLGASPGVQSQHGVLLLRDMGSDDRRASGPRGLRAVGRRPTGALDEERGR
jgi:hypothetical protein